MISQILKCSILTVTGLKARKGVIKMVCSSVKEGYECTFMSKKGCQFNGGNCHPIVEMCEGCQRVTEFPSGTYCLVFPDPQAKWRLGNCNMATHIKEEGKKENGKINPLKASKRSKH
jgi:hypothetical protein